MIPKFKVGDVVRVVSTNSPQLPRGSIGVVRDDDANKGVDQAFRQLRCSFFDHTVNATAGHLGWFHSRFELLTDPENPDAP